MIVRPIVLLNLFVVSVMLSIGLRVTTSDLMRTMQERSLMLRSLLANCLIVPAFGLLLVHFVPMPPEIRVGILLLAIVPGTPIALQFTRTASARLAFAASIVFFLSLLSIVIAPLAVMLLPQSEIRLQEPLLELLRSILLYIAAPLLVGIWLSRRIPRSRKLVMPLNVLATIAFLTLMVETRALRVQARHELRGGPISAMVALLVFSMVLGWFLGGRDRETRRVLATSTSMRSVVLCFYIARYCFPGTQVFIAPLMYLSLMVPINALFTFGNIWLQRREKAAESSRSSSSVSNAA